jgi:AbrB family looped-hinge helix DNA binding protein
MKHESNMTSKGQVTVPKAIRDALGLKPGQKVRFELDDDGNARIVKYNAQAAPDDFRQRLAEAQAMFRKHADFQGMDGLEYQRWIRESPEV